MNETDQARSTSNEPPLESPALGQRARAVARYTIFAFGIGSLLGGIFAVASDSMRPHFINLLYRSWISFLDAEGSSTTGVLSGWISPVVILAVTLGIIWSQKGPRAVMDHWKSQAVTALRLAVVVALIIYSPVFVWQFVHTIYLDHTTLLSKLQLPLGGFQLGIGAAAMSLSVPPGSTVVEVDVDIHNSGPDSIAHGWALKIAMPLEKKTLTGIHLPDRKPRLDLTTSAPLDERFGNGKLVSNGDAYGPVTFLFEADRKVLMNGKNTLILSVLDGNNRSWQCERTIESLAAEGARHLIK